MNWARLENEWDKLKTKVKRAVSPHASEKSKASKASEPLPQPSREALDRATGEGMPEPPPRLDDARKS